MALIHYRFTDHEVSPDTQVILLGTFNPETPANPSDFFYSRRQNHLWTLLPKAFGYPSLKFATKEEKHVFILQHRIDFLDLITTVDVEIPNNYNDDYIDDKVVVWKDVIGCLEQLPDLRAVLFTRKTLSGIPNLAAHARKVEGYCQQRGIPFHYVVTPARVYTPQKQLLWTELLQKYSA